MAGSRGRARVIAVARNRSAAAHALGIDADPILADEAGARRAEVEELEALMLLDGEPGTPALRVLPTPKPPLNPATAALYRRARLLWPGLDARALSRCGGDPRRVARLVARRTVLTEESIVELLLRR